MKKIIYIVKNSLHYYPPCISQIRIINDLKVDIEVLYGTSDNNILKILNNEGIVCNKIPNVNDNNSNIFKKLMNWYSYRKGLSKILKTYDMKNIVLWFGTADSVLPMKGKLKKYDYVCFVLELMDEFKIKLLLLKKIMQQAKYVCVCEKNRAYLQQYWWKLKRLPYVFPNKPYRLIDEKISANNKQLKDALNRISKSEYILYQGILQNKEELIEIAKALNSTRKHYKFVLMGIDKYNSVAEIKKYYNDLVYISYIPAPLHLVITKNAHIGIAYYRPDSLNKVYCAPNKIYEYSAFGIPMICNNVPGLLNTVGLSGAAECINLIENEIKNSIDKIDDKYLRYSKDAKIFYSSTDNVAEMKRVLEDIIDDGDYYDDNI